LLEKAVGSCLMKFAMGNIFCLSIVVHRFNYNQIHPQPNPSASPSMISLIFSASGSEPQQRSQTGKFIFG